MLDHIRTVLVYVVFRDWSALLRAIAAADLSEKPPRPTTASPQTKQSAVPLEIRLGKEKIEIELLMRITGLVEKRSLEAAGKSIIRLNQSTGSRNEKNHRQTRSVKKAIAIDKYLSNIRIGTM